MFTKLINRMSHLQPQQAQPRRPHQVRLGSYLRRIRLAQDQPQYCRTQEELVAEQQKCL